LAFLALLAVNAVTLTRSPQIGIIMWEQREERYALRMKRTFGLVILFSGLIGAGCVGYLTGSYDIEMQRLRTIIAELEAKNAALAEECIDLRKRLREPRRIDQDRAGIVDGTRPQDLLGSGATPGVTD
jgi:hypothetical protein